MSSSKNSIRGQLIEHPEMATPVPVHHERDDIAQSVRAVSLNGSKRLVAILPRGETIRNFVYTGALDEVSRQAEVTVLSVSPNEETADLLRQRYQEFLNLNEYPERWIVNIQREVLDMAHGRWLWSAGARERWRQRDAEASSSGKQWKRWVKKMTCYPFANRAGLELLSKAERASSRLFRTTDEYVRLFKTTRPTLVFNGSHVHSRAAIQPVQAAQWLGIPTATFIFSWDNLTSQGRVMPPYDFYLVWNEGIRAQLLNIYRSIRPEQVFVTGTPQFDFHFRSEFYWTREEFCARVGADPKRPIILYSTGIAHHMPGETEIVEGIADILKEMTDFGPPQLLVRVYPKDSTDNFEKLKRKRPDILFPRVPWERAWYSPMMEDSYLLTNTLRHADLGINIASTISLELCMFDKPVLNVAYNPPGADATLPKYKRFYDFDHYRPVVESGAVTLVNSEGEMRNAIVKALTDPGAACVNRRRFIKQTFDGLLDGRSSSRIADVLLQLANEKRSNARD